jgi:hypothetical protein
MKERIKERIKERKLKANKKWPRIGWVHPGD